MNDFPTLDLTSIRQMDTISQRQLMHRSNCRTIYLNLSDPVLSNINMPDSGVYHWPTTTFNRSATVPDGLLPSRA